MNYQVMPPLSSEEYAELKNDIAQRGVMVPIEYDEQGNVLDGHHRLQVCAELGITEYPKVIRAGMTEAEKRTHARKLNMARRQLSGAQKRELTKDEMQDNPYRSDRQIATDLGVSNGFVSRVRKEMERDGELCTVHSSIGADGKERPRQVERKIVNTDVCESIDENAHVWDEHDEKAALYDLDELFVEHPCLSDLVEVVEKPRKPVSVFNPTSREEKAMKNPDIVERMADTGMTASRVEKQIQLEEARQHILEQNKPTDAPMLYVGDGIGYRPYEHYDLLLTDPPYSTDIDDIKAFVDSWLFNALDCVKDTGFAYIFIGAYPKELQAYLNAAVPPHMNLEQVLVWTYKNTLGQNPKDRYKQNWQACLFYRGKKAPALDCPLTNEQWAVQEINAPDGRQGDRYHAWQKPIEIAERFIRHSTKPGAVVFDPFACTGTFLLAAAKLGRKGIGFEIDPENAAIAEQRGCALSTVLDF